MLFLALSLVASLACSVIGFAFNCAVIHVPQLIHPQDSRLFNMFTVYKFLSFFFFFPFWFVCLLRQGQVCSSDWPRIHCSDQVNLELTEILPPGINGVYHHCLRQGLTAEFTTLCLLSSGITAVHCHICPINF